MNKVGLRFLIYRHFNVMLNSAEKSDTTTVVNTSALRLPAVYGLAVASAGLLSLQAMACAMLALMVFWLLSERAGGETPEKHGIASFHASRMGGVIFFSFALLCTALEGTVSGSLPSPLRLALCAWMFAIGFFEDLHGLLPASTRLILMLAGTAIAIIGEPSIGLQTASVGVVKSLFSLGPWITVPVSILGLSFLINAFNTADGANGLLGMVCVFALLALAQQSSIPHGNILLICAAGIMVFLVLNIGLGNVFMGDGGAYFLGAVVGIALIDSSNAGANLWWLLCLVFYPHVDLLWSMIRRIKAGMSPMGADNEHLHNLLFARLRPVCKNDVRANSITGLTIAVVFGGIPLAMTYLNVSAWGTLYSVMWVSYVATWLWLRPKVVAR